VRPPIVYLGGKIRLADRLLALMPEHGHYVEPFAGSLAVLLAKPRAPHETVNDRWGALMTFWRVLREQPDALAEQCALTPHSRAEHASCRDLDDPTLPDLERARRVWVRLTQGRAGVPGATGWRHYQAPAGSCGSMPDYLAGYVRRIPPAARRLLGVSLECRPALDVIADYGRHDGVLLYVDPPYLGQTRSDGSYAVEMSTPTEHTELAAALLQCRASVFLSGYPDPLYDNLYADWHRVEIPTATGQGGKSDARTEVVWSNRPLLQPDLLDELAAGAAS
jgi:DNA adenine methylase